MGKTPRVWLDLDPGFVDRVMITTIWLGAIIFLCLGVYVGFRSAAAWAAGVALGLGDLFLIQGLIREGIGRHRKRILALYFVLKFAALYGFGAVFLLILRLDPYHLLAGFSLFLFVSVLKVLGRLVLSSRWLSAERKGAGGRLLRAGPGARNPRS